MSFKWKREGSREDSKASGAATGAGASDKEAAGAAGEASTDAGRGAKGGGVKEGSANEGAAGGGVGLDAKGLGAKNGDKSESRADGCAGAGVGEGAGEDQSGLTPGGENTAGEAGANSYAAANADGLTEEIEKLKRELDEKEARLNDTQDKWRRALAEFDNYKKRTAREKEALHADASAEMIAMFLPVYDNLERAVAQTRTAACDSSGEGGVSFDGAVNGRSGGSSAAADSASDKDRETNGDASIREGVALIEKQMREIMTKLCVEPLPGIGEPFDPNLHDAVMHFEDDNLGKNVIAEIFVKGYRYKDRIVRHSMVKVAN